VPVESKLLCDSLRHRFPPGESCPELITHVLPLLLVDHSRAFYLLIAEVFAPVAECLLFWLAFGKEAKWRDFAVIVIANVASFLVGEIVF